MTFSDSTAAPGQDAASLFVADAVVDRRQSSALPAGGERRQFGNSHSGLSASGRELAAAIDQYKMSHHRRYITCDEMLVVLNQLGYRQIS